LLTLRKLQNEIALLGAALAVTASLASPASAQEVIENPGRCSQYYPNANCQNLGPGNPFTNRSQAGNWSDSNARMGRRMHGRSMHHHPGMRHGKMHKRMH